MYLWFSIYNENKQHWKIGLHNAGALCFLLGGNWHFIYTLDGFHSSCPCQRQGNVNLASAFSVRAQARACWICDRLNGTRISCPTSTSVYLGQYQSTITPAVIYYEGKGTGEAWDLTTEVMLRQKSGSFKRETYFNSFFFCLQRVNNV